MHNRKIRTQKHKIDPKKIDPNNIDPNKIVTIQSLIRRKNAINKYSINHLDRADLKNYRIHVIGNDPEIPLEAGKYCDASDKIVVVGTSVCVWFYLPAY